MIRIGIHDPLTKYLVGRIRPLEGGETGVCSRDVDVPRSEVFRYHVPGGLNDLLLGDRQRGAVAVDVPGRNHDRGASRVSGIPVGVGDRAAEEVEVNRSICTGFGAEVERGSWHERCGIGLTGPGLGWGGWGGVVVGEDAVRRGLQRRIGREPVGQLCR